MWYNIIKGLAMTKVCLGCKKELALSAFHKKKSTKDGLRTKCRDCRSMEGKQYYKKNAAELRRKDKLRRPRQKAVKLTIEEVLEKCKLINPTLNFDDIEVCEDYTKPSTRIKCSTHGYFNKSVYKLLKSKGCPTCAKSRGARKSYTDFCASIPEENAKYILTENAYIDSYNTGDSKLLLVCPDHGTYTQSRGNLLLGQIGCRKCRHKIYDTETFIDAAKAMHGTAYGYDKTVWKSNKQQVIITCKKHGEFKQLPAAHVVGSGCSSCSKSGFDYSKPGFLYLLQIESINTLYKIGVTNYSVNERFSVSELKSITVLASTKFETGLDAYKIEQRILKEFKPYQYTGPKLLKRGNTEIIIINPIHKYEEYINEYRTKRD